MSLYLGNDLISGGKPINLGVRNIGEIVASSLPLTDAGLHLLDGTLILGGGIYQGFVDYIANLYAENPSANYFTDETTWQTSVNTYGVCGKFVYDSTNNTVRLPKVTGKIDGTTDINALGDLEPLFVRLPNITSSSGDFNGGNDVVSYGAMYSTKSSGTHQHSGGSGPQWARIYIDASRSSSVYSGNGSDTAIHEQAIKCFIYIVIATSSKTEIQTDIDTIATDLNNKVDLDGTNATFPYIVETYVNGTSGYNLYSNGYCEQWGKTSPSDSSSSNTITFMKPFIDSNYSVSISINNNEASVNMFWKISSYSNTQLTIITGYSSTAYGYPCWWKVCGYIN